MSDQFDLRQPVAAPLSPHRQTAGPQHPQRAVEPSHLRLHLLHIDRLLAAPFSNEACSLTLLALALLRILAPFPNVLNLFTGNRQQVCSTGTGCHGLHLVIDDRTRLSLVEILSDEHQEPAISFVIQAVA